MEEKKEVKIYIKIENKEEIENWAHGLVEELKKANSLADELANKNAISIPIHVDGKEFAKIIDSSLNRTSEG